MPLPSPKQIFLITLHHHRGFLIDIVDIHLVVTINITVPPVIVPSASCIDAAALFFGFRFRSSIKFCSIFYANSVRYCISLCLTFIILFFVRFAANLMDDHNKIGHICVDIIVLNVKINCIDQNHNMMIGLLLVIRNFHQYSYLCLNYCSDNYL